ncbi:RNA polymerase sigma factor [uncultured Sphingomonas sp.]|uniref:RNA polymerase sigma factor n=1 Tax=uncultured Sphingomonas sp. TaxID=158754 RepID=UPI00260A9E59|nr:RNA polymerase sigma factor [uncultured Sphingomonas sp.]
MTLDLTALTDGELAALSIAGRDTAFAEIMRRHREPVFRIIAGNIGDRDEALDLVQECFVSAHRALRRYDPDRVMRRWLTTIALNKCRDWRRRRMARRLLLFALPLEGAAEIAEERSLPDAEVAAREELARVSRAIAELPAALREPLVLHVLQDMSQAETAATLSISEKAVETRVRRARAKLAERLKDR